MNIVLKEIEEDYDNMKELFFGEYSSFEEIMDRLKTLEKEIQKLRAE